MIGFLTTGALVLQLAGACTESWRTQRDDPSEYTELAAVPALSAAHCIMMAAKAAANAVSFSEGTCSLLQCLTGEFGCRKCRNAINTSLPELRVRQLSKLDFCWRTFQHRVDDSVNFFLLWSDYVTGFGQGENGNFWMGLEPLHQLTLNSSRRVRWEFSDWNDTWNWSENPDFSVSDASENYRLSMGNCTAERSSIGQYPIERNVSPGGKMFSTFDADNDVLENTECAWEYHAGWWFGGCGFMNPNGLYYTYPAALDTSNQWCRGLFFFGDNLTDAAFYYSMKTFECLVEDWL